MSELDNTSQTILMHRRWTLYAAAITGLVLLYLLRIALVPFVLAGGFAIVLAPAVNGLARLIRCRRWIAAAIVFLLFLALLAGLICWVKIVVLPDAIRITRNLPKMLQKIFVAAAGGEHLQLAGRDLTAGSLANFATEAVGQLAGSPAQAASSLFGILLMSVLTLSTLCYFLISGPRLVRGTLWLFPRWLQPGAASVGRTMRPFIFRYVLGILACVSVTCVLCWLGLGLVLQFPHAIVLALLVAILELVPVVGAVASAILISLAAIGQGDLTMVIGAGVFTLILRLLIDQLVAPIVFGKAADLHPAVVLFAMVVSGALFGMLGLLVAVPAATAIKIIMLRSRGGLPA